MTISDRQAGAHAKFELYLSLGLPGLGARSGLMWRDIFAKGTSSKDFREAKVFWMHLSVADLTPNVLGHRLHNVSDVLQR
jgi:hypothetical protein